MDHLETWELNDILDNIGYVDKITWEQTRTLSYILAQVNSKKKLKPSDVIQFKWDKQQDKRITHEELDNILKNINNGKQ